MKRLRKFKDDKVMNTNSNEVADELEKIHDNEIADVSPSSNDYERK